jgi:hypothetical protein
VTPAVVLEKPKLAAVLVVVPWGPDAMVGVAGGCGAGVGGGGDGASTRQA